MSLLPLTFIFPLIGFLILAFMRDKLSETIAAIVGVGSMLLSALCTLVVSYTFLTTNASDNARHGQCQAIKAQAKMRRKVAHLEPCPHGYLDDRSSRIGGQKGIADH